MNVLRGIKCRWGDTCWGLISRDSNHRHCGCNSGGWQGFGIYYGGYKNNNDGCGGQGGGFSGPKTNGQAKGNLASVGLTIKISALGGKARRCCIQSDQTHESNQQTNNSPNKRKINRRHTCLTISFVLTVVPSLSLSYVGTTQNLACGMSR